MQAPGIYNPIADNLEFDQACQWLKDYKGNFEFYLSLRAQLDAKGYLSDKQIDAIKRAIARDLSKKPAPMEFSIKPGSLILTGKYFARQLAFQAGLARPHHAFEVLECLRETEKAWQLRLKLSAQRTTHCSICGAWLSDPRSVSSGVGPVCAERTGIPQDDTSLELLAEKLATTQELTTWFPKSAVKEGSIFK